MKLFRIIGSFAALVCLTSGVVCAEQTEKVDASDPTKIYSYAGLGYKLTEYDNGDSLNEVRAIGNIGFSDSDMLLFEIGYGNYSGTVLSGENDSGATNTLAASVAVGGCTNDLFVATTGVEIFVISAISVSLT